MEMSCGFTILEKLKRILLTTFYSLLRLLNHFIFYLIWRSKKGIVPPVKNPLLLMSATKISAQIREGKLLSEEVVKAYIERIKEVQPYINAVAAENFAGAMEEAQKVDKLVSSGVKSLEQLSEDKPLLGVPFTVKILIAVKDMPCNVATLYFKDRKADEDGHTVAMLRNAGAIFLANTTIPDFGSCFDNFSYLYGRTTNPYDTSRTCGISSGGEAALIASGGSLIGLGNDLGGSMSLPSAFNGVFCHKATQGIVSNKGIFPTVSVHTDKYMRTGPICRYAEDLITCMKVLASPYKSAELKFGEPVNFSNIRLCCLKNDDLHPSVPPVDQDINSAQQRVLDHFEMKYKVFADCIKIKTFKNSAVTWQRMMRDRSGRPLQDTLTGGQFKLSPAKELCKYMCGLSKLTLGTILCLFIDYPYFQLSEEHRSDLEKNFKEMKDEFSKIFEDKNTVLILPTCPFTACYPYEGIMLSNAAIYVCFTNLLNLPVSQCPVGLSEGGKLPMGLQVVAGKGQDNLAIACAMEIEKSLGGWVPPNQNSANGQNSGLSGSCGSSKTSNSRTEEDCMFYWSRTPDY